MPQSTRCPQPAKALLALRDIPQSRVAADLNLSAHWVGRVLNGRERPSEDFARRLSKYLDVPAADLFSDDDSIVVEFVRRTRTASGVPQTLEDPGAAEQVAHLLRGAQ